MTVGEKIKYFRTLHGFTQDQLIQTTGLSISTLQNMNLMNANLNRNSS